MATDEQKLVLFDFETGTWSDLVKMQVGFPNRSRDGHSVYFLRFPEHPAVMRIRISDRKLEQVADLKNFEPTAWWGIWLEPGSRRRSADGPRRRNAGCLFPQLDDAK